MKALLHIQSNLKAPKGQFNDFGKYKYRSCEDILEAVKPLLAEADAILTISDELVQIGERYYVKAIATLTCGEESQSVTAYAREEESKKGMDGSQVTGAASSYARKYALNGLFCIDDTKDSDATNDGKKPQTDDDPLGKGKPANDPRECEICGKPMTAAQVTFSKNKFGRRLCSACQTKEGK